MKSINGFGIKRTKVFTITRKTETCQTEHFSATKGFGEFRDALFFKHQYEAEKLFQRYVVPPTVAPPTRKTKAEMSKSTQQKIALTVMAMMGASLTQPEES